MSPVEINFLLFSSVFSLVTTIYLSLAALNKLPAIANNRFALLAADAMTMTFWFAGFIALAVFLSSRVCFGNVCNVAKASVAFGAFNWYFFHIDLHLTMMYVLMSVLGYSSPSQRHGQACTLSAVVAQHQRRWNHQCRKAHNYIRATRKNASLAPASRVLRP
jgi:Membrane-associating domain